MKDLLFDLNDYLVLPHTTKNHLQDGKTLEEREVSEMKSLIQRNIKKTIPIQRALFAESKQSILFVFQAMDAAGKDSTIRNVFSGLNPQGIESRSFKKPSAEELAHDYLWRVHKHVPARGNIGIFNRSHYEEVLVTKVHEKYILYQNLPNIHRIDDITKDFWAQRYEALRSFEKQLDSNGCKVVKFFLNVSLDEQKRRLLSRMDVQEKNWKVKLQDTLEREYWDKYQDAYKDAITQTSTEESPWYIIPADHKWTMRGIVSTIILEEMKKLHPQYPMLNDAALDEMNTAKDILTK